MADENNEVIKAEEKAKAAGAGYVLCSTGERLHKLIFEDMRFMFEM